MEIWYGKLGTDGKLVAASVYVFEMNWLHPEPPDRESSDYGKYIEQLQHIENMKNRLTTNRKRYDVNEMTKRNTRVQETRCVPLHSLHSTHFHVQPDVFRLAFLYQMQLARNHHKTKAD